MERQGSDDARSDLSAVYVFSRSSSSVGSLSTTVWTQQAKLHASDPEASNMFGSSVSLYGDTVLIGASGNDNNGITDAGRCVYVLLIFYPSSDGISKIWTEKTNCMHRMHPFQINSVHRCPYLAIQL